MRWETHAHTSEASACATASAADMAWGCKRQGYDGMFITDHFFHGNTCIDRSLPWTEWVRRFSLGFYHFFKSQNADLIISATGHRKTLVNSDAEWTNLNCFIVDVGINFTEEGKLVGDCEDITLRDKTPVPSGCGLLTRLALITNLLQLYKQK